MSKKKRLTVSKASKIAKSYLTECLGKDDVVEEDGIVYYRGPIIQRDYMLTFEKGFDENSMLLSVKRIPVSSDGIEGLDWMDNLLLYTDMGFFVDFLLREEDTTYPFFKYNYWFSTLNSEKDLERIIEKAALIDVTMCEMVFAEELRLYLEAEEEE